jgi:glycerol-3-phosphate dehydrogenase
LTLHAGLTLYWLLAGMKPHTGYHRVPRTAWHMLDGLHTDNLQHVYAYTDAQTDDTKLTKAVIASAISLGAELACPARFLNASVSDDGCEVTWLQDGIEKECRASAIVNAAGPWARNLATTFSPPLNDFPVDNIQGAHIEVPGMIEHGCYYLEAPQDKRAIFIMPWKGHTMIGTTENSYSGDPAEVRPLDSEISYLQEVYRYYFPSRDTQVINAWAGLRVLPAAQGAAFKRSRETRLPVDRVDHPRVLTIYGGKLTGYRVTALKVMQKLAATLPLRNPVADTSRLTLKPDE